MNLEEPKQLSLEKLGKARNSIKEAIMKVNSEIKVLELEWLHLKGAIKLNLENDFVITDSTGISQKINYDDVNIINSEEFSMELLEPLDQMLKGNVFIYEQTSDAEEEY